MMVKTNFVVAQMSAKYIINKFVEKVVAAMVKYYIYIDKGPM